MNKKKAEKILESLAGYYGDTRPGLSFTSIYQLTIAVVLSAQTTDRQVNAVSDELFEKYPGFESLAAASLAEVEAIIKSTGFYHNKAKNIIALSRAVTERFDGEIPPDINKLTSLPGVGRKSANVILSIGFGIPALAVDTHVGRIANRLGFTSSEDPFKIEQALTGVIPPDKWTQTHLLFITHGRKTCMARSPSCAECPAEKLCAWDGKKAKKNKSAEMLLPSK
jgi:endonuclease-3